ncbi:choice-of-anchor Q domain-containing protein [Wenzhouxiangella sp. EGI_FJ10305]|uniref:choice-of-anchor Q domain-containing protein n=1 Tax=Wenzhouxiangella sp. EGI_FJ10305 TaxID=3243768 RepID=UPI0035D67E3C
MQIQGPGSGLLTIDGQESGPVMEVDSGDIVDITISGLTITGGQTGTIGAGIRSTSQSLILQDVVMDANSALDQGAAIWHFPPESSEGFLEIRDSIVRNNSAGPSDVTPYLGIARGGGVSFLAFEGSVIISNTKFINNQFERGFAGMGGGAVAIRASTIASLDLESNEFIGNSSDSFGGGFLLDVDDISQSFVFSSNVIENNVASDGGSGGGAFFQINGSAGIGAIELSDNQFLSNSSSQGTGGAVMAMGGSGNHFEFIGNTVLNNDARSAGGATFSGSSVTVKDSLFEQNTSEFDAGGLSISASGEFMLENSDFIENESLSGSAGGLYVRLDQSTSNAVLQNVRVVGNKAAQGSFGGFQFEGDGNLVEWHQVAVVGNRSKKSGGGGLKPEMQDASVRLRISNSEISENTATESIGGISVAGNVSSVWIQNATVSGNESLQDVAGMSLQATEAVEISFSTIANNSASTESGGIFIDSGACDIANSIISDNIANNGPDLFGSACLLRHTLVSDTQGSLIQNQVGNLLNDPNANLSELGQFGGPTRTHAIDEASSAFDAGAVLALPMPQFDQRGADFSRVVGPFPDMGAIEYLIDEVFMDGFQEKL